jgi:hypothetical protein
MFTKTSIPLAFILAISSSVIAAEIRPDGVTNDQGRLPLINRCSPENWDPICKRSGWFVEE